MRTWLFAILLIAMTAGLTACSLEWQPSDPNLPLPPGDRPARGPGLFTGEDGVFTIQAE